MHTAIHLCSYKYKSRMIHHAVVNTTKKESPDDRVSNRKSESMQNQSISVFSVRSTLGMIETTLQISETLEKVCENALLNHKYKYQKTVRDQNYVHKGNITSCNVYRFYGLL